MVAVEIKRFGLDAQPKRNAEAHAEILLEPGRPGETLGTVDDLREAGPTAILASPELPPAAGILGHAHRGGDTGIGAQRQWRTDQPARLRKDPAKPAHPAF